MELSQDDIDLIDRFNNGELSAAELTSFNERMKDAEFASSVSLYNEVQGIILHGGRADLRNVFSSIQSRLESTGGFEKYKPGKSKGGDSSGGWIAGIIVIAILIASYLYYTGKIKSETIHNLFQEYTADTVYHYIYHTDTIYVNQQDSLSNGQMDSMAPGTSVESQKRNNRKTIRIDTVYRRTEGH